MLGEGSTTKEMMDALKCTASQIHSFVFHTIFLTAEDRSPEQKILRERILEILLAETVLAKALRAVSETVEKRSLKVTTLLNLSKSEQAALEKQGYADFIEEFDDAAITLKVEETKEIIPPDLKILEKLLGYVEGNASIEDVAKGITPFSPPAPETPEV